MKNTTVSIGISAFNEEANIKNLIIDLLSQKQHTFDLKEIIIISDGSSDKTIAKVREIKDQKIRLINSKRRLGINKRLNQIVNLANSEILVILDADVLPANKNFLEKIINPIFKDSNIGLVGANTISVSANTLVGKIISNSHQIKQILYVNIKGGNNIYLCHGRARALSRKFYKQLKFPENCPEDAYSYLKNIQLGFKFNFAYNAQVIFKSPSTFTDHAKQSYRFLIGVKVLEKYFSPLFVRKNYRIPLNILFAVLISSSLKYPLYTIGYIAINSSLKLFHSKPNIHLSRWDIAQSTKRIEDEVRS